MSTHELKFTRYENYTDDDKLLLMVAACSSDDPTDVLTAVDRSRHQHQCGACGTIWTHSPSEAMLFDIRGGHAHACPKCGEVQRERLRDSHCATVTAS